MVVHHLLFTKFMAKAQEEEQAIHSYRFQVQENIARNWVEEVSIKF